MAKTEAEGIFVLAKTFRDRMVNATAERQPRIIADTAFLKTVGEDLFNEGRITGGVDIRGVVAGVQARFRSAQHCPDPIISERYVAVEEFPESDNPELITVCISEICRPKQVLVRRLNRIKIEPPKDVTKVLMGKSEIKRTELPEILRTWLPLPDKATPAE